jgi:hypothetical protein
VILAAISTASVMAPTVNDFANKAALRPIGRQSSPCRSHHLSRFEVQRAELLARWAMLSMRVT